MKAIICGRKIYRGEVTGVKILGQKKTGPMQRYLLGTLIAVELLMSFSFLGYVHIEPISVTTAYIPVLLAGVLLGPLESTALGAVFGLASMWKASADYVSNMDRLFSPFMSGNPLGSLFLSVGSRMLFGLAVGLLYRAAVPRRYATFWVGAVSFLGRFVHSFFVYSTMALFFPEAGYVPADAVSSLWGEDSFVSNLLTAAAILIVWSLFQSQVWRQFRARMEAAWNVHTRERYHRLSLVVIVLLTLCSSVAVAFYFVHRIDYILEQKGIELGSAGYADVLHLQIQFLFGILSLMMLVIVFLLFNRTYATYAAYESRLDPLTGVMNRKAFFQSCQDILREFRPVGAEPGYFIMVDLDWFKEINDRYGHPEGDRALREVADHLREIFDQDGIIGRLGGDEFGVFLHAPMAREVLEVCLYQLRRELHRIQWEDSRVSCSIGALPVVGPAAVEECYRRADRLLYQAKEQGRDQYVIGEAESTANESTA